MFKANLDKLVDGLKKEFVDDVAPVGNNIQLEIGKQDKECLDKKEEKNLLNINTDKPTKTTKVPVEVKLGGKGVKPLSPKDKPKPHHPEDKEIVERFQDKEMRPQDSVELKKDVIVVKTKPSTEFNTSGKKTVIIDDLNYLSNRPIFLKDNSVVSNHFFIKDSLRGRSAKYWSLDKASNNFSFVGNETDFSNKTPYSFDFQEILDDTDPSDFGRTYQIIGIEAKRSSFKTAKKVYSKDLWNSYILGKKYAGSVEGKEKLDFTYVPTVKEDVIFTDHSFGMSLPLGEDELEKLSGQVGTLTAQVNPEYNFLIEQYEETISKNKDVLENTLPNLYVMLSEAKSEKPNPEFSNMISLNGTIQVDTKKVIAFKNKGVQTNVSRTYDLKKNPIGEYFDLFGRQYQEAVKNGSVKEINKKFSNIAISIDDIEFVRKSSEKKEIFPMYVGIKFSTDKTTTLAQTLKDTNLLDEFTTKIINRINKKDEETIVFQQATEEILQEDIHVAPKKNVVIEKKGNRVWDLADILKDIKDGSESLRNDAIYLGEHQNTEKANGKAEFKFFRSLMSEIFESKLQTIVRQNFRTYEDIIDGNMAYNETVLYRIAKFIGTERGNQPIQNIFIPNATNLDVLEYIDTQVKYDTKYTYVIYAYQFVIGNKYWYSNLETEVYDHHATLRVYQEPSLKLVEIPYYKFTSRIMDKPPAPPEVQFISYKNVDNKMLLLFNNAVNSFTAKPIIISPTDSEIFEKIKEAQKLKDSDPIKFGGDDRNAFYEVYRLDKKPKSYADFDKKIRIKIDTDVSKATIQKATSAAIIDSIEPNKKFYYTFRAIDIHKHISNPTSLYEVEMINEHGTIFPIVKVIDFQPEIEKEPTKTMKRFLQISPTILQTVIDEDASGFKTAKTAEEIKNKIALGLSDEKVWGKKFRIILTSKSTGRKIEFDLDFQHLSVNKRTAE